ncbi:MAG: hypothetical protein ACRDSQ_20205 [Actinokineospora sp.]
MKRSPATAAARQASLLSTKRTETVSMVGVENKDTSRPCQVARVSIE